MTDEPRRVMTLTKGQCATREGTELVGLLTKLCADGMISREEVSELRSWLEVDRGVDFAALPFLYQLVDEISGDGELSEEELDRLGVAIERVLPKSVRTEAALKRKQARESRRLAAREKRRQTMMAEREEAKAKREAAQARAGILYRREFPVRGAFRFAARREACERLIEGDTVSLEREPDNAHDPHAILALSHDDSELGYVPREEASEIAPLLDDGAEADATIQRLWQTPEGQIVPILLVKIRRGDSSSAAVLPVASTTRQRSTAPRPSIAESLYRPRAGCASALFLSALLAICLLVVAVVMR